MGVCNLKAKRVREYDINTVPTELFAHRYLVDILLTLNES